MASSSKSKLMLQLGKEKKKVNESEIDEERIEDIFTVLSKIEPKNLMLMELLIFLIEKGFVKNSCKIYVFMDLYHEIKGQSTKQTPTSTKKKSQDDQQKFTKQKFLTFLKQIGKIMFPGNKNVFQQIIYHKIAVIDEEHRLKIEEPVKKFIARQSINKLREYNHELQVIFQVYMPQNYNNKMSFNWKQLKFLQKKLPILSFFRFLWEVQIIPHYISPSQFLEMMSKLIPPLNSNHKEVMFYYSETITNYVRDSISLKVIKTLDGDIGLSFFEFCMGIMRIAVQFSKENKNDSSTCFQKLCSFIKIKQSINQKGEGKGKSNKFEESLKTHFDNDKRSLKNNFQSKKRETKKKIEQIIQNQKFDEEETKNQFKVTQITPEQFFTIKKGLDDDQLPKLPQRQEVQKQNDDKYDIEAKHIVIGEQLPKTQQKNKPPPPKKGEKKEEMFGKFKAQEEVVKEESSDHFHEVMKNKKKMRINHQFPVILNQIIYPSDIPSIAINPKAQIYLQTTIIHLGEKLYEKAYINYTKAKMICEPRNPSLDFFFQLLEAQIYESAGRDGHSLLHYHKAKQIIANIPNKESIFKGIIYRGLGCNLYHLEEYEYAVRCFLKAKEVRGNELREDSIENALLENNIGCCMMLINRHTEAMKHFEISECILDLRLGKFNEKTLVVQQNASKNKKAYIQMVPHFKTMWRAYVEKPLGKQNKAPASKGKA